MFYRKPRNLKARKLLLVRCQDELSTVLWIAITSLKRILRHDVNSINLNRQSRRQHFLLILIHLCIWWARRIFHQKNWKLSKCLDFLQLWLRRMGRSTQTRRLQSRWKIWTYSSLSSSSRTHSGKTLRTKWVRVRVERRSNTNSFFNNSNMVLCKQVR